MGIPSPEREWAVDFNGHFNDAARFSRAVLRTDYAHGIKIFQVQDLQSRLDDLIRNGKKAYKIDMLYRGMATSDHVTRLLGRAIGFNTEWSMDRCSIPAMWKHGDEFIFERSPWLPDSAKPGDELTRDEVIAIINEVTPDKVIKQALSLDMSSRYAVIRFSATPGKQDWSADLRRHGHIVKVAEFYVGDTPGIRRVNDGFTHSRGLEVVAWPNQYWAFSDGRFGFVAIIGL